jgi:hypothetical protein
MLIKGAPGIRNGAFEPGKAPGVSIEPPISKMATYYKAK